MSDSPTPESLAAAAEKSAATASAPRSDKVSRRLHLVASWAVAAALGYYFFYARTPDFLNKLQGLAMLFLAAWPALQWTKSATKRFPLVEVLLLTTANSYALPLLNGQHVAEFDADAITTAAWVVLAFQVTVIGVYSTVGGRPQRGRFWTEEFIGADACRYLNYGMIVNTIFLVLSTYFDVIPNELGSIVRAACVGIGIVCTFVTARLWGAGQLNPGEKTYFLLNLAAQTVLQVVTLYLLGAISALALAALGYVSSSRRLPVVAILVGLTGFALLHNGKSSMRLSYWDPETGAKRLPELTALPTFFAQWLSYGVRPAEAAASATDDRGIAAKLLERTSLFQMVCFVVDRTPEFQPYLSGESYSSVLAQFVPRFLWPDKPSGLASTAMLSIYYGLQTEEGAQKTSIAFGQVAESYANFSLFGVIGLGAAVGFFYKKVQIWTTHSPILSYAGVLLVLLLAWTIQVEMTFGTWISSLWQGCCSVLGLLLLIRSLLR